MSRKERVPEPPQRHPQNVDGDFYVGDGCCLACDVPRVCAPTLFEYAGDRHCYVSKQPSTPAELFGILKAMRGAETSCIRYAGTDVSLLKRIAAIDASVCDDPRASDLPVVPRDVVIFRKLGGQTQTPQAASHAFGGWLKEQETEWRSYAIVGPKREGSDAWVLAFAWYERDFHSVRWSACESGGVRVDYVGHRRSFASTTLEHVYDWLVDRDDQVEQRWYSRADLLQGGGRAEGAELPW